METAINAIDKILLRKEVAREKFRDNKRSDVRDF